MTSLARKLEESLEPKPKRRQRKHTAPPILGPGRPDKYLLSDGKTRVPSVTTITGRFKNAAGLINWAWKEGAEGRSLTEKRDAAGDAGTIAHQWIQDDIGGRERTEFAYTEPELLEQAARAVEGWHAWAKEVDLVVVETEVPLVSEKLNLGGTPDGIVYVKGEKMIPDWKTGNRIYSEVVIQLAAYRQMLRERDGRSAPRSGVALRLDKETGEPTATLFPPEALDLGWEYFRRAREMYGLDQSLEKLVKRKRK